MNNWSCSVQAAAKVMCIPTQQLVDKIGHDGSEIVFPDLLKPMCHAGFHNQEIQDAALRLGWIVTTFEARPVATPDGVNMRDVFVEEKLEQRFDFYLRCFNGIACGQRPNKAIWHYNFWIWPLTETMGQWYDAGGRELSTPNIQIAYFYGFMKIPEVRSVDEVIVCMRANSK